MSQFQPSLSGGLITTRPLLPEDFDSLFLAASDPAIWEQHFEPDRYKREVFTKFFNRAIKSRSALLVKDSKSHEVIGTSRYERICFEKSECEIGYTFLIRRCWGLGYNTELKHLMINHAFKFVKTIILYVSERNLRSQKAVEKLGAMKTELFKGPHHKSYVFHLKKENWNPNVDGPRSH